MIDLLLTNGIVVTMNQSQPVFDDGAVAISGEKIIDVGPSEELENRYSVRETIDATNMLILPGLVNAHVHAGLGLLRGLSDDFDLTQSGARVYVPFGLDANTVPNPKDIYAGTLLSCLEFIRTGTTCIADQDSQIREVAKAIDIAGIRGVLAYRLHDVGGAYVSPNKPLAKIDDLLGDNVSFIREWDGKAEGRIRCCFGPVAELRASKELLIETARLASELKVGIHMHLSELHALVTAVREKYGMRPVEYAFNLGLLRPGLIAAHCCWLSENDITLLSRTGASVAHTPTSEMKLSDGVTPVPRLLESGVNVALGTDAVSCNNSSDMIREMKMVSLLHKIAYPLDPTVLPAKTALELATIDGAKATTLDKEIGSIEKGKKADVIMINLRKPHLTPVLKRPQLNVLSHLVYSAVGDDVDTVIVNGKIIMFHRKILTLNEEKVIEEAQLAAEEMVERISKATSD